MLSTLHPDSQLLSLSTHFPQTVVILCRGRGTSGPASNHRGKLHIRRVLLLLLLLLLPVRCRRQRRFHRGTERQLNIARRTIPHAYHHPHKLPSPASSPPFVRERENGRRRKSESEGEVAQSIGKEGGKAVCVCERERGLLLCRSVANQEEVRKLPGLSGTALHCEDTRGRIYVCSGVLWGGEDRKTEGVRTNHLPCMAAQWVCNV